MQNETFGSASGTVASTYGKVARLGAYGLPPGLHREPPLTVVGLLPPDGRDVAVGLVQPLVLNQSMKID